VSSTRGGRQKGGGSWLGPLESITALNASYKSIGLCELLIRVPERARKFFATLHKILIIRKLCSF